MNYINSVKSGFKKYATFSGRAARSEYWNWVLFNFVFSIITSFWIRSFSCPDGRYNRFSSLEYHFYVVNILTIVAVAVRRLHDVDYKGWWLLISLTGIGIILLLIWFA